MESGSSALLLLFVKAITLASKLFLFIKIFRTVRHQIHSTQSIKSTTKSLWVLVGLILFCSMFSDLTWILKLLRKTILPSLLPHPVLWFIRINWAFVAIEYLSLSFLIEKLINKDFNFKFRHHINLIFCTIVNGYLIGISFLQYNVVTREERYYEYLVYKIIDFYVLFTIIPTLFLAMRHANKSGIPRILQYQSKILFICLLTPHLLLGVLSANPFTFATLSDISIDHYVFIGLGDLMFLAALYYCARKMLGLRFLNMHSHVQSFEKYNFIDDFKAVLEQLSMITTPQELPHLTKLFFERAFNVISEDTQFYLRNLSSSAVAGETGLEVHIDQELLSPVIEQLLTHSPDETWNYLASAKILIRDEIEFDYFYEGSGVQRTLIDFMDLIDAGIFLPLYDKQTMIAYIVIRHNARPHKLFSNVERDEMLIFAGYLSTIIHLLRHRNLKALVQQEKELKEELYFKQQEIQHYRESIRTLLKTTHTARKIGVLYCKSRSITWGNHAARELLAKQGARELDPHQLISLKKLALDVKKYGSDRHITLSDPHGNQIVCTATLSPDKSQVVMLVFYPTIADTFTIPFETLKDISAWDYAICLETTKSGQLINQLIPSSSEALLQFKINLLKLALSKGATLIELPEYDITPVAQIVHHISLRSILHTITLERPEELHNAALELFGMEPMLSKTPQQGVLETLSDIGTIHIQNVEHLALDTQEQLLTYLHTGIFQPLRSDRKIASNVRIICSTTHNIESLVHQGKFLPELYHKLKKSSISLPSLLTIPQQELTELAKRFSEQAIKNKELTTLISLNEKETGKIINERPTSLYEFKERVQTALMHKSTKQKLNEVIEFNPAYLTAEPEIAQAIKLGKHALKDRYIMRLLWNKFKNQTKIATLLNVNRSSVNRRCKEFKLISEHEHDA